MKILQTKKYEEADVVLRIGEDFLKSSLYNFMGTGLKSVDSDVLTRIAKNNGYDEWAWSGHYNEDTGEVEAKFRKEIRGGRTL